MKPGNFSILDGNRGNAFVELAFILPLLVLLVLGVFDFSRAIHAKNIIANISREGANMASRSALAPQDIMNALAYTAQPLDMRNNGMMYLTVIQGVSGGNPKIRTQTHWTNTVSSIRTVPSRIGTPNPPSNPNPEVPGLRNLNLSDGQTAQVIEVFYRYQGLFSISSAMLPSQYYSMAVF